MLHKNQTCLENFALLKVEYIKTHQKKCTCYPHLLHLQLPCILHPFFPRDVCGWNQPTFMWVDSQQGDALGEIRGLVQSRKCFLHNITALALLFLQDQHSFRRKVTDKSSYSVPPSFWGLHTVTSHFGISMFRNVHGFLLLLISESLSIPFQLH